MGIRRMLRDLNGDLEYDGQFVTFRHKTYRASSGFDTDLFRSDGFDMSPDLHLDFRHSAGQCTPANPGSKKLVYVGPIPEGRYKLSLQDGGEATVKPGCDFNAAPGIQTLPQEWIDPASGLECRNIAWGHNRVRLEAADQETRHACKDVERAGFYLHDSTKGYTHGCVEVDTSFFSALRAEASQRQQDAVQHHHRASLYLYIRVKYKYADTYGGTRK